MSGVHFFAEPFCHSLCNVRDTDAQKGVTKVIVGGAPLHLYECTSDITR